MPEDDTINEDDLSPLELEELQRYMGNFPTPQEKAGIFNFFNKILKTKDSIKVSNLDNQELMSVRTIRSAGIYADEMGLDKINNYLNKEAEVILGSSTSKKGFLITAAITQKKELSSGKKNEKTGWFKKNVEGQ